MKTTEEKLWGKLPGSLNDEEFSLKEHRFEAVSQQRQRGVFKMRQTKKARNMWNPGSFQISENKVAVHQYSQNLSQF